MQRETVDFDAVRRELDGRCSVCEMLAGNPDYEHRVVYQDDDAVAFLNRYPIALGYVLVAPKQHREHVTGDFTRAEYVTLQSFVHRVGEAIHEVLPTERLYIFSFGSQQGNAHVHWHVVPLPPDVPFERQQVQFVNTHDRLVLSDDELDRLAIDLQLACERHG